MTDTLKLPGGVATAPLSNCFKEVNMKPVKNIMLQEMLRLTQSFCTDHLAVFLNKFELKSAQLHALGTAQTATDMLAMTQLPRSAHKEFTNTFLASTLYTFADFQGKLEHNNDRLAIAAATSETLESELALPVMIDKAERRFSELLYMLNKRLSVIGQHKISIATNPLAPVNFALALEQAIQNLPWDLHTRIVAYKVFDYEFLRQLGSLYIDVNQSLAGHGILSNLKHFDDDDGQTREALSDSQQALIAAHESADKVCLESSSAHVFGAPGLTAANDGTALQPLEYTAELFDSLLNHSAMSEHLKNHLSRLYTPYVKLALSDAAFANSERHPAKRLLDSLVEACALYSNKAGDLQKPALLMEIKSVVQRLINESDGNRQVFSDLAFRFSAYLRQCDRQITQQSDKRQKGHDGTVKLQQLKQHICQIIEARINDHQQDIPKTVADFLVGTWANYVTSQYLNAGSQSDQAGQTLAMVDQILAYVAPVPDVSVPEFTIIAPTVRQSLIAAGSEDLEIRHFLQQLIKYHRAAQLSVPKPRTNQAS